MRSIWNQLVLLTLPSMMMAAEGIPAENGFTVHEWGTFTSVGAPDGSPMNWRPLVGTNDLPCFVERFIQSKGSLRGTVRMETPVIYFYSPREAEVSVQVTFPAGLLTEWYPRAASSNGSLTWSSVKMVPAGSEQYPKEPRASHYYAARQTSATPLRVEGKPEKFLFYRGVGAFDIPVSAKWLDGKIAIKSGDAILFESRAGRAGYRLVPAGSALVERPKLSADRTAIRTELTSMLIASGLFPDEARAMVATWSDSWFEEGTRLFYIMQSGAVDKILPLSIRPAPASVTRVFVGRVEIVTPETKQAVKDIVMKGDLAALAAYGRFLEPVLTQLTQEEPGMRTSIDAAFRFASSINDGSGCPR